MEETALVSKAIPQNLNKHEMEKVLKIFTGTSRKKIERQVTVLQNIVHSVKI